MIRPPQRAVTRFFIPLIDVLILLFCIFLLMPFVSSIPDAKDGPKATEAALPENVEELQRQLLMAQRRIEELKKERGSLFERFRVKVLEIDRETGKLFAYSDAATGRQEIQTPADASRLIDKERGRAGAREVCFLILYPRQLSGFPVKEQIEAYRRWFRDVPYTIDIPWSANALGR